MKKTQKHTAAERRALRKFAPTRRLIDSILKHSTYPELTAALLEQLLLNIAELGVCGPIVATAYAMSKGPDGEARLGGFMRAANEQPARRKAAPSKRR